MKRRSFLKTTSAIATATVLPNSLLFTQDKKNIGLQLYTIRKEIGSDLEGSLKKAGYEPLDYFKKYPGRFSMWHVKDMDPTNGKFTDVGSGNIDFKAIFENRKTSGLEHFFVELDFTEGSAMESIKISLDYLNKAEFVI